MSTQNRLLTRARYNREYFGFIVGFPDGDIVLVNENAESVLNAGAKTKHDVSNFLISELNVRDGFFLSTPPLVWLELTRKCNLSCPHCYIRGGTPRRNELTTAELIHVVDELADMGVWAIAITGGEPTLHDGFVEIVKHAHSRGLLVGIATNGTRLSEAMLEKLPRTGVIISISVDDLHLDKAADGVEFAAMTKALSLVRRLGFEANVMTNTNRRNIGKLSEMMAWAKENDISIRSVPFSPLGRGKKNRDALENRIGDVSEAARFWLDECSWEHKYHERVGLCVGSIFNYGLSLAYMTRRCSSGRFLCYILF